MVSFLYFKHILERPEASSHMIEHTIQHYLYAVLVQIVTNLCEVLVCAKPCVYFV